MLYPQPDLKCKWEIKFVHIKTDETWELIKEYAPGVLTWEFTSKGQMIERIPGRQDMYRDYKLSNHNLLYITQLHTPSHDFINAYIYTPYRILWIFPDEMTLYDLIDVDQEPSAYSLAIRLRRIEMK